MCQSARTALTRFALAATAAVVIATTATPAPAASSSAVAFTLGLSSQRPASATLRIRPASSTAGSLVDYHFALSSQRARCVAHATVALLGRRIRTDNRGLAAIRLRVRAQGLY